MYSGVDVLFRANLKKRPNHKYVQVHDRNECLIMHLKKRKYDEDLEHMAVGREASCWRRFGQERIKSRIRQYQSQSVSPEVFIRLLGCPSLKKNGPYNTLKSAKKHPNFFKKSPLFLFWNEGFPKGGEEGADIWEKFPKNPVFLLGGFRNRNLYCGGKQWKLHFGGEQ